MLQDHVCQWIQRLKPRIAQYLYYQDAMEKTYEKMRSLKGREQFGYQVQVTDEFFASDFYNADFDPWPDLETRIDRIEDLQALVENDIDRKKFENSIAFLFSEEDDAAESLKPSFDPQQAEFFSMMSEAYGTNDFFNTVEKSKTEAAEILSGPLPEELETGQESGEKPAEDLFDLEGADDLRTRLADILDGHIDSF